MITDDKQTTMQ